MAYGEQIKNVDGFYTYTNRLDTPQFGADIFSGMLKVLYRTSEVTDVMESNHSFHKIDLNEANMIHKTIYDERSGHLAVCRTAYRNIMKNELYGNFVYKYIFPNESVYIKFQISDERLRTDGFGISLIRFIPYMQAVICDGIVIKNDSVSFPHIFVSSENDLHSKDIIKALFAHDKLKYEQIHHENMRIIIAILNNYFVSKKHISDIRDCAISFTSFELRVMDAIFSRRHMYQDYQICKFFGSGIFADELLEFKGCVDNNPIVNLKEKDFNVRFQKQFTNECILMEQDLLHNINYEFPSDKVYLDLNSREINYIIDHNIPVSLLSPAYTKPGSMDEILSMDLLENGFQMNIFMDDMKYVAGVIIEKVHSTDIGDYYKFQFNIHMDGDDEYIISTLLYNEHGNECGYDMFSILGYQNILLHTERGNLGNKGNEVAARAMWAQDTNMVLDVLTILQYIHSKPEQYRTVKVKSVKRRRGTGRKVETAYVVKHIIKTVTSARKYVKEHASSDVEVQYVIPSWTRRGHYRTYANGKQVWIEGQKVQRRKQLSDKKIKIIL